MKAEGSPKKSGVSNITGNIIRIRHANEHDMVFIKDMLEEHQMDTADLHHDQCVIATENSAPIGCGRLKKVDDESGFACTAVDQAHASENIDVQMVEHLIDYAVVKNTFVLTKKTGQYKEIGFEQTNEPVGDLMDRIADECARSGRNTEMLMVYRK